MRARTLLALLIAVIAGGTVFFRAVEGWTWLDSYFFTVVTLSTVGYGDPVPVTVAGKIGTTVFILVGLGIFAVAIQQFGSFAVRKREEHTEWLIARLGHHNDAPNGGTSASESGDSTSANEDAPPR
jgi:voltage-gated potassium channel